MAAQGNVVLPVHIRLNDTATEGDEIPARFSPATDPSVLNRAANAEAARCCRRRCFWPRPAASVTPI